jgi:hypothetical protein
MLKKTIRDMFASSCPQNIAFLIKYSNFHKTQIHK